MTDKKEISWRAHPIVDDFPRSILAIVLLLLCSFVFYLVTGVPGIGLFAFLVFFLSTLTYFIPVRYKITSENLHISFLAIENVRSLKKFRNFYVNPAGVHFSTFSQPSPLDSFRGNFVRFNSNRDEVVRFLHEVFPDEVIANSKNMSGERKDLFESLRDLLSLGRNRNRGARK